MFRSLLVAIFVLFIGVTPLVAVDSSERTTQLQFSNAEGQDVVVGICGPKCWAKRGKKKVAEAKKRARQALAAGVKVTAVTAKVSAEASKASAQASKALDTAQKDKGVQKALK